MKILNAKGSAAGALTVTIPGQVASAPDAQVHTILYVRSIEIRLINGTSTAVAASAILSITSTNLGGWAEDVSNAAPAFSSTTLVQHEFEGDGFQGAVNAASTIICPTAPAGCYWEVDVGYYHQ
jgi:hypothetical protein